MFVNCLSNEVPVTGRRVDGSTTITRVPAWSSAIRAAKATKIGKIINIHPALLPRHGGKGMYGERVHKAVKEQGDTESGITIHYVNENYDEGNVIFQAVCPVLPTDTCEDIAAKVHALEYEHFPRVIEQIWG